MDSLANDISLAGAVEPGGGPVTAITTAITFAQGAYKAVTEFGPSVGETWQNATPLYRTEMVAVGVIAIAALLPLGL